MLILIARRLLSMALIMLTVTLILAAIMNSKGFKDGVAVSALGNFAQPEQREAWLGERGYNQPFLTRYAQWIGLAERKFGPHAGEYKGLLQGYLGMSEQYKVPVSELLWPKLANTGILAGFVFLFMIPLALAMGILSGMSEGSAQDRGLSVFSVLTTSIPEFASAAFLVVLCGVGFGVLNFLPAAWQKGNWLSYVLPIAVLVIYDMGYVARMTRASMAEVMQSQYIRTAVLKGVPRRQVIMKHALRNALIAPFTVIILQLNWLLSGVIVVEVFFAYKGFGLLLYDAALFPDVDLLQACALIAVFVAVGSQLLSDIGYTYLNPRIRFS